MAKRPPPTHRMAVENKKREPWRPKGAVIFYPLPVIWFQCSCVFVRLSVWGAGGRGYERKIDASYVNGHKRVSGGR